MFIPTTWRPLLQIRISELTSFFFHNEVCEVMCEIFVYAHHFVRGLFRSSGRTRFFRATASIVRCPPRSPTQQHTMCYRGTRQTHNKEHWNTEKQMQTNANTQ